MNPKWIVESRLALKAVSAGADMLDRGYKEIPFRTKENSREIVTELDVIIEEKIRGILKETKHRVIGEEIKNSNYSGFPIKGGVWVIDPIDGTSNFVSSLPIYSVSVGFMHNSKFSVGAVVIPAQKELFFTMGNQSSFMNNKTLRVDSGELEGALIAASFSSRASIGKSRIKEYEVFGKLNDMSRGCLRLGAASVNICYVAAGRLQCAYGISNKIWDVAGGLAIALRAGCKVYIEFIKGTSKVNYAVGVNGAVDEIASILKKERLADLELTE
ncbi:MAG: inositol monophosphatase family protein [Candidatus Omnitrophota bacterium]|jgi:myo-inositol-1(or 4)-monophosphatase